MKKIGEYSSKEALFLALFTIAGVVLSSVAFSNVLGVSKTAFSLFQFVAPVGAQLFSPAIGVLGVVLVSLANFSISGAAIQLTGMVSIFTLSAAAYYFGSKDRKVLAVPVAAMALFALHPAGSQVAWFGLFWLVPIAVHFLAKDNLFANSLGATFTAHAIGSVAYLYAFNIGAEVWAALPPIVVFERLCFAAGIAGSYVVAHTLLAAASEHWDLSALKIDRRHALKMPGF